MSIAGFYKGKGVIWHKYDREPLYSTSLFSCYQYPVDGWFSVNPWKNLFERGEFLTPKNFGGRYLSKNMLFIRDSWTVWVSNVYWPLILFAITENGMTTEKNTKQHGNLFPSFFQETFLRLWSLSKATTARVFTTLRRSTPRSWMGTDVHIRVMQDKTPAALLILVTETDES